MITLYGIPNCDTVKKARKFLEVQGTNYTFHDFRKDGLEANSVQKWVEKCGLDVVLNKRGTTWRKMDKVTQANILNGNHVQHMVENPTLIKRPVLVSDEGVIVGFKTDVYEGLK